MENKMDEFRSRLVNEHDRCDLCHWCRKAQNDFEKCPYIDRMRKALELMKEFESQKVKYVEDRLGENPHKNEYIRLSFDSGPIVKCESYEGAFDIDAAYPRKIACLCGSTRFKKEFEEVQRKLTLAGYIVLSVGLFSHEEENSEEWMTEGIKTKLDNLHIEKIAMSDFVAIINKDNYIGESTKNEIRIAEAMGKPIYYLEDIEDLKSIQED